MQIVIDNTSDNKLYRIMYYFDVILNSGTPKLVFSIYSEEERTTKRHGFKNTGNYWHRLEKRKRTMENRPNVPSIIKIKAKQVLIDTIETDF
jgi:hypothetical protein